VVYLSIYRLLLHHAAFSISIGGSLTDSRGLLTGQSPRALFRVAEDTVVRTVERLGATVNFRALRSSICSGHSGKIFRFPNRALSFSFKFQKAPSTPALRCKIDTGAQVNPSVDNQTSCCPGLTLHDALKNHPSQYKTREESATS